MVQQVTGILSDNEFVELSQCRWEWWKSLLKYTGQIGSNRIKRIEFRRRIHSKTPAAAFSITDNAYICSCGAIIPRGRRKCNFCRDAARKRTFIRSKRKAQAELLGDNHISSSQSDEFWAVHYGSPATIAGVYLVKFGSVLKIGTSKNILKRLLSIDNYTPLTLDSAWYFSEPSRHKRFKLEKKIREAYGLPAITGQEWHEWNASAFENVTNIFSFIALH